jgi:hypothetical protein
MGDEADAIVDRLSNPDRPYRVARRALGKEQKHGGFRVTATLEKPDAIISLSDWDESINMLLYGDSGIGKTVFGGGAGLILGVEKGAIAAKRQGSKADLWPINNWTEIQKAYVWLKKNPTAYSWVCLDSVTEMQQKALRWILAKELKAAGSESNRDIDIPQIQDHQKWQNMFKRFIVSFCELPVNMLFTALPLRVEDEEGMEMVLPDLQGKGYQIAQWVCAQMSVVGHMKKVRKKDGIDANGENKFKEVRRVRFQYSPPYFAKDRYDVLGKYWDDPTLAEIDARIKGESPEPSKPRKTGGAKAGASNGARKRAESTASESPAVPDDEKDIVLDDDENEENS